MTSRHAAPIRAGCSQTPQRSLREVHLYFEIKDFAKKRLHPANTARSCSTWRAPTQGGDPSEDDHSIATSTETVRPKAGHLSVTPRDTKTLHITRQPEASRARSPDDNPHNVVRPIDYKYPIMPTKKTRLRHIQLTLDQARQHTGHGGWRRGAGRPKTRDGVAHDVRAPISKHHPQHVTLRIVDGAPTLRQRQLVALIRRSISRAHRDDFRIAEFNVESNHLHLIVEADSNDARKRGLQRLNSRIARSINTAVGRTGRLFDDRFDARELTTPRAVRNALRYVLNNARHHGVCSPFNEDWVDPFSSAMWFTGWRHPVQPDTWWKRELLDEPSPVAAPRTWLLRVGWRRHGEIDFGEMPAPSQRARARQTAKAQT